MYDKTNIFAKILKGEIKTNKIYEDHHVLVFEDAHPLKSIHYLAIPKGEYEDFCTFVEKAPLKEQNAFWDAIHRVVKNAELTKNGFRLITNQGKDGGQEVYHFHVHILGGEPVGPVVSSLPSCTI